MTEETIFALALEQPDAAARAAFLAEACGADAALRQRVEALLRTHEQVGDFLNKPVVEQRAAPPDGSDATQAFHAATDPKGPALARAEGDGSSDEEAIALDFLQPSARPDALGRLGHYEVLQVLGKGGFGIVFRAFDEVLHRVVALKVLAPAIASTSPARKRFLREARSSAQVRHDNVVQVYAVEEQPVPYLVMEFIPGETLQQRLDRVGPLEVPEILRLGRQIAEGLAAAHASDLIHRDIKPGNVLLEGGHHRVKITDFGLARAADDASMSRSGVLAGTPMYMAPEQANGETLDHRADLFSLGSVLYQMTSGRPPFRASSTLAVLKRVAEDTPRPIREIIPETPQWLCDIIAKLHAKNPDERFQSAREVADVLADCEGQLKANSRAKDFSRIPRSEPTAAGQSGRWKRGAAAAVLLPVLALAVTEFVGVTQLFRGRPARRGTIKPGNDPSLVAKKGLAPNSDGFVPLFNGTDLTGWQAHPAETAAAWRVEDGTLVGSGAVSYLFRRAAEYDNFHLRADFRVNTTGNSGVYFRSPLPRAEEGPHPKGYEAQILGPGAPPSHYMTGSLINFTTGKGTGIDADTWYRLEVMADGPRLQVKINGVTTTDVRDQKNQFARGHIALQLWEPGTAVRFRKIEIKETVPTQPTAAPVPSTYTNGLGMEFVLVPKGKSWLGGGKDRLGDREVEVPADFYLGKYEVTQEEWEKVMGENPSYFSRTGGGRDAVKDVSDADLKRFPVEKVSWDQCQIFVAKLNQRAKESGWVYRLPTEAEWEYACRGGPTADRADSAFDFYLARPTNTLLPGQANFKHDHGPNRPGKVGSYEPNRLGLHDMHGNVWEWCEDAEQKDGGGLERVHRGGGWNFERGYSRASIRYALPPSGGDIHHGLRLARVPADAPVPEVKTPPLVSAPFTDADVQRIAALPAAEQVEEVRKELMRRNPGFDGTLTPTIKDGVVTGLSFSTDQVDDIAPVRALKELTLLNCEGSRGKGKLADLSPLRGMKLTVLILGSSPVRDLTPLEGMPLTLLNLYASHKLTDLSPLRGMPLRDLVIANCPLSDLTLLKGMPLHKLDIQGTRVEDLAPLQGMKLTWLCLLGLKVRDLGPLQDMKLTHLDLRDTPVQDLNPLTGMPLDELWLGNCRDIRDLEPLKGMKISYLVLFGCPQVRDLELFKDMPLKQVEIYGTGITDLTPLRGKELEMIRLTPGKITQGLDILRGMKSLKRIGISVLGGNTWPAAEFWERYDKGEFK